MSRPRYANGRVMFATPLLFGWASPYFEHHLLGFTAGRFIYAVVSDVLLLVNLFVLGGGSWDKLRSLLKHDAYAVLPDGAAAQGESE